MANVSRVGRAISVVDLSGRASSAATKTLGRRRDDDGAVTILDWRALHADAVVSDAHNDRLLGVHTRPVNEWGDYFRRQWLPQLTDGGVNLQVLPVFVDDDFRLVGDCWSESWPIGPLSGAQ